LKQKWSDNRVSVNEKLTVGANSEHRCSHQAMTVQRHGLRPCVPQLVDQILKIKGTQGTINFQVKSRPRYLDQTIQHLEPIQLCYQLLHTSPLRLIGIRSELGLQGLDLGPQATVGLYQFTQQ
jgi:hypothetical protein